MACNSWDRNSSRRLRTDLLGEAFTTLPEVLQGSEFKTVAFVGNPWLRSEFGFAQGFDQYDDSLADWDVPGDVVSEKGLAWLNANAGDEPFFLYLHYMDSHRPYGRLANTDIDARLADLRADTRPLTKWAEQDIGNAVLLEGGRSARVEGVASSITLLEMAYDRGVENFDRALGAFLAGFRSHEAYERTAILVLSDHGEALYTRGWGNHGGALYEDEIAIPFAARLPGVSSDGPRIESPVGLLDVLPTMCAYLGVSVPRDVPVFGRNWLAPSAQHGSLADRYMVIEGVMRLPTHRAIRFRDHKALWQPKALPYDPRTKALFRIDDDPGEANDLLATPTGVPNATATFEDLMRGGELLVTEFAAPSPEAVEIDPGVLERLRSLGYVK